MLDEEGKKKQEGERTLGENTKKTTLLRIMPQEFIKEMRNLYNDDHKKLPY